MKTINRNSIAEWLPDGSENRAEDLCAGFVAQLQRTAGNDS